MLNTLVQKVQASLVRFHVWWQSETSTLLGYFAAASGVIAKIAPLFTDSTTAGALHDLGLAEAWIKHIASALIIAGALLITPRKKSD